MRKFIGMLALLAVSAISGCGGSSDPAPTAADGDTSQLSPEALAHEEALSRESKKP